jgi:hypothetical protein
MSEAVESPPAWTEADAEELFTTLGRYWIIFQWIEARLDQILLLGRGQQNWKRTQKKLAGMTNSDKIEAVEALVLRASDFARVHTRPTWVEQFKSVIQALHEERNHRNSLIHSQILFEFADMGLEAPLLSTRKKNGNETEMFERQWLSKEFQHQLLMRLSKLAWDVNHMHIQLIHDYRALVAK